LSYAADKQTDRQTDIHTEGLERPTHADYAGRCGQVITFYSQN